MELQSILTPVYVATMCLLGVYGAHRVCLLLRFRWGAPADPPRDPLAVLPRLTVQLPIYNERTVAARLIQAAGALQYPRDRFEIQVLDDSTDDTTQIVDDEAARLRRDGVAIEVLRRPDRRGFKAGALAFGLTHATGELICIFDADFVPGPDFLERLVGWFADPKVGLVQARWGHRNRDDSLLTRAQSTLLDGHFIIEHKVRHDSGVFFNFNGTAGIWRRAAITSAGGWQHDTLTEDLDLSYRAQLDGWKFIYAPCVVAPAEVPPDIGAFKSQQHRWAKGSVQVFRKLGWRLLVSDEPWRVKLEALAHLSGNVGYPCVFLLALLLPISFRLQGMFPHWIQLALFLLCTASVFVFYECSQRAVERPLAARVRDILAAVVLGIGMCISQTRAVLEGCLPGTGVFVRTPKRGDTPSVKRYRATILGWPGVELLFAGWFAWGMYAAVERGLWGTLPFLALFFASFVWVGSLSLREWGPRLTRGMRRRPDPDAFYSLTFDCYGTLIDWRAGIEDAVSRIASLARCDLGRLLHDREHIERELQRGPYRAYGEVLATSLARAAHEQSIDVSPDEARTFAASMPTWPPFAESRDALSRLATRYQLAILSNVETRVLEASVRLLDAPFEDLITAEQVHSYKPSPAHFAAALERLGLEPRRILHVAGSVYHDLRPASALGFTVAWVNRYGEEAPADLSLDWIVPDLTALASELGC